MRLSKSIGRPISRPVAYGTKSNTLSRTPMMSRGSSSRMRSMIESKQARAAGQVAAEFARPAAGAQKLVQQVAVAGLHVDKLKADLARQVGRRNVGVGELVELGIGEHDRARRSDRS